MLPTQYLQWLLVYIAGQTLRYAAAGFGEVNHGYKEKNQANNKMDRRQV